MDTGSAHSTRLDTQNAKTAAENSSSSWLSLELDGKRFIDLQNLIRQSLYMYVAKQKG